MSKEQLIAKNEALRSQIHSLREENELIKLELGNLKRMIFGQKTERFVPAQLNITDQLNLFNPLDEDLNPELTSQDDQQIQVITKKKKVNHRGRNPLPAGLVEEIEYIEPDQDVTNLVVIGEERTETLDYIPPKLIKKVRIRKKYVTPEGRIIIAPLPARAIEKSIAEPGLLSYLLVSKFVDHLPFYRLIKMFERTFDWTVDKSTINSWMTKSCVLLTPLYNKMKEKLLEADYLQVDESTIKVQTSAKKGKTHLGYQWVYLSPIIKMVVFDYSRNRKKENLIKNLKNYKGHIQCDGYAVYEEFAKMNSMINLLGCLAHVRRKFYEALTNDKKRSDFALQIIGEIYALERASKQQSMDPGSRLNDKQTKIKPLLDKFYKWIEEEALKVGEKSPIAKAMRYALGQKEKIYAILSKGKFELDNNLIENQIRPLALGRKNYLFAGSHASAQRIAILYSLFASCKLNKVNPSDWLIDVLKRLPTQKMTNLEELLPQNWSRA